MGDFMSEALLQLTKLLMRPELTDPTLLSEELYWRLKEAMAEGSRIIPLPEELTDRANKIFQVYEDFNNQSDHDLKNRIKKGKQWLVEHENSITNHLEYIKAHDLYMSLVDLARRRGINEKTCWTYGDVFSDFERVFGGEVINL
jgi:hypothetical protein